MRLATIAACLALTASTAAAESVALGGDVSRGLSPSQATCSAASYGTSWQFVVAQSYNGTEGVNPAAPVTLANAKAAGIEVRDILHRPAVGKAPFYQVKDGIAAAGGAKNFSTIWFSVDKADHGWGPPGQANCNVVKLLLFAAGYFQAPSGIRTTRDDWLATAGPNCTAGKGHALWFVEHATSGNNFTLRAPFGGWTEGIAKQYEGRHITPCGVDAEGSDSRRFA